MSDDVLLDTPEQVQAELDLVASAYQELEERRTVIREEEEKKTLELLRDAELRKAEEIKQRILDDTTYE